MAVENKLVVCRGQDDTIIATYKTATQLQTLVDGFGGNESGILTGDKVKVYGEVFLPAPTDTDKTAIMDLSGITITFVNGDASGKAYVKTKAKKTATLVNFLVLDQSSTTVTNVELVEPSGTDPLTIKVVDATDAEQTNHGLLDDEVTTYAGDADQTPTFDYDLDHVDLAKLQEYLANNPSYSLQGFSFQNSFTEVYPGFMVDKGYVSLDNTFVVSTVIDPTNNTITVERKSLKSNAIAFQSRNFVTEYEVISGSKIRKVYIKTPEVARTMVNVPFGCVLDNSPVYHFSKASMA